MRFGPSVGDKSRSGGVIELSLGTYGPLRLSVAGDFDALREEWRAMQLREGLGPCQSAAWAEAHWTSGFAGRGRLALVAGRDRDGRLDLVLPFVVRRWGPLRIARLLSNAHAAHRTPPIAGRLVEALRPGARQAVDAAVRRLAGADLVVLERQAATIAGRRNPWRDAAAVTHADLVHDVVLTGTFEAFDHAHRGTRTRKLDQRRRAALAESHAASVETPASPAGKRALLEEVLTVKRAWLAERGFAGLTDPAEVAFLQRLAELDGEECRTDVTVLRADGEVAAGFVGVFGPGMFAGFIMAIGDRWQRFSPGTILVVDLFRRCFDAGVERLSLGAGENPLKARWADARTPLFGRTLPEGNLAAVVAFAVECSWRLRDFVKSRPDLHQRAMAARARLWEWTGRSRGRARDGMPLGADGA